MVRGNILTKTKLIMNSILKLSLTLSTVFILSSCGGGGGGDDSASTGGSVFRSCGMENGPLRIMPIGDSVTEAARGHNSFRLNLWDKLIMSSCDVDFVGSRRGVSEGFTGSASTSPPNVNFDQDHESYWGRTTDEVSSFADAAIAANKPHIALIHLGTNDAIKTRESAATTISDLSGLIDKLRAHNPSVRIVLSLLIPSTDSQSRIDAINAAIPGFANSKSTAESPILVVNQASGYSTGNNYDGIHPAPSGEEKIAQKYLEGIMAINGI